MAPVAFLLDVDNTLLDNDRVEGRVLIYVHKELELDDLERRYPAEHYVIVDDKLRLLAAIKRVWGRRVTTVFARQGHYARDPEILSRYPSADISLPRIGHLLDYRLDSLLEGGRQSAGAAS